MQARKRKRALPSMYLPLQSMYLPLPSSIDPSSPPPEPLPKKYAKHAEHDILNQFVFNYDFENVDSNVIVYDNKCNRDKDNKPTYYVIDKNSGKMLEVYRINTIHTYILYLENNLDVAFQKTNLKENRKNIVKRNHILYYIVNGEEQMIIPVSAGDNSHVGKRTLRAENYKKIHEWTRGCDLNSSLPLEVLPNFDDINSIPKTNLEELGHSKQSSFQLFTKPQSNIVPKTNKPENNFEFGELTLPLKSKNNR